MAVFVALLSAAVITGCGAGSDGSGQGDRTLNDDMAVKFTQCMREHGVDIADPQPGQPIRIQGSVADQSKIQAAQEACKKFAPKGDGQGQVSGADLDRQQALVDCLRGAGIDVENPVPGQPLRVRTQRGDEAKAQQAMTKCQQKVGAPSPVPGG